MREREDELMNREMRRMAEREERRQKKLEQRAGGSRAAASQRAATLAKKSSGEKLPLWKRVTQFLHEVRVELRKVSWPTRDQMVAFTVVTVVTSAVLTGLVFTLDFGLKELVFLAIGGARG